MYRSDWLGSLGFPHLRATTWVGGMGPWTGTTSFQDLIFWRRCLR